MKSTPLQYEPSPSATDISLKSILPSVIQVVNNWQKLLDGNNLSEEEKETILERLKKMQSIMIGE